MIKILACIFMLIDHIGLLFFPDVIEIRAVGRISMPLFAYCIVRGIKNTRDIKKYIKRIFICAVISQIPFIIMVGEFRLNICFLWCLGTVSLYIYERFKRKSQKVLVLLVFLLISNYINVDYGMYGAAYLIITYYFSDRKSDILMYCSWILVHLIGVMGYYTTPLQIWTLLSIPIIYICNRYGYEDEIHKNFIIQYFYPIHIALLILIKYIF